MISFNPLPNGTFGGSADDRSASCTKADLAFGAGFAKALNSLKVFQDSEAQRLRNHAVAVK